MEYSVFGGQRRPTFQGGGCSLPQFLSPPTYKRTQYEKQQPILHGDETRCERHFYTVDYNDDDARSLCGSTYLLLSSV